MVPSADSKMPRNEFAVAPKNINSNVKPDEVTVVITEQNGRETVVEMKESTMATENIKKMPAVKVVFNPYKNVQGKSTEGKVVRKDATGDTINDVITDSEILSIDIEKAVKEARKSNTK